MVKKYAGLNLTNSASELGRATVQAEKKVARNSYTEIQPKANSKDLKCVLCNQKGRKVTY